MTIRNIKNFNRNLEQEVTYSTVRFHKSSGLQNQVSTEETQGPREAGHRGKWHGQLSLIRVSLLLEVKLHVQRHLLGVGCLQHWFCYGIKCYYFIMDRKTWSVCKQTCQNSSLSVLKIDDEDELVSYTLICFFFLLDSSMLIESIGWNCVFDCLFYSDLVVIKSLQARETTYFSMASLHDDDCGKRQPCTSKSFNHRSQSAV
uniref:Uncharacterized protein n=1 Tax=Mus spicilegus TaxID=10103 RepID=A0A8C6G5Q3_MUSSI